MHSQLKRIDYTNLNQIVIELRCVEGVVDGRNQMNDLLCFQISSISQEGRADVKSTIVHLVLFKHDFIPQLLAGLIHRLL